MKFPVFDLHCDTVNELLSGQSLARNEAHIDLERAGTLAGYAQCFACFTTSRQSDPKRILQKKKEMLFSQLEKNRDRIAVARSARQIEENCKNGKMSAILTLEGTCGFGCDPDALGELYEEGFRMVSLCWNEQNALAGSCKTGGGLTSLGYDFVREAQRLGFVMDVSHISDDAFWDMIKMTKGPIVASHSNSRSVWNHIRNVTDDMFRAIVSTGGVVGINLCPDFVGENADLETVCNHMFHFLQLDPEGTHVSLGGDLDGIESLPKGFEGVEHYPRLADLLLEKGLSPQTVRRIFWENAIGVFASASQS